MNTISNGTIGTYSTQLPLIYKKMHQIMQEIGVIGKNQKNVHQGFKFRGIDDMLNNLYPALCKHGVFMAPRCTSESHELRDVERSGGKKGVDKHVHIQMEYTFWAEDGSNVTVGPIAAEGLDSGDKATNKALSAALKYALIQTFSIPTEDMEEGDRTSPEIGVRASKGSPELPGTTMTMITGTEPPKRITFRKPQTVPMVAPQPAPVAEIETSEWEN